MNPIVLANVIFKNTTFWFYTHIKDQIIGECLRQGIIFEEQELKYLNSIVKPGTNILDAGANIGLMSIPLAKLEPSATFFCFEPDPLNYALLNLNIDINQVENIHTFNYALGNEQKFITFYKNNGNFGDHRVSKPLNNDFDSGSFSTFSNRVLMVNIVDFLNKCLDEKAPKYFDVLKIDTQGADFNILDSCLPLIENHSKIVMEYSPFHLLRNGTTKEEINRILDYFPSIGIINRNDENLGIINTNKEKILNDFDTLSPTLHYYDITLQGKNLS
ncbi:FkbM family methyltransferase [Cytobacillus praedii]|uniref:FkbM family methyltransferase n=1 Tax=Cytobacillus praedii TaxID=1742358 RepID=UPI003F81BEE1